METSSVNKISVRALVEFSMQGGDLGGGFISNARAVEGTRAHHLVSSSSQEAYMPEVPISLLVERQGVKLEVAGRIDGIITTQDEIIINEVKSVSGNLEAVKEDSFPGHWAQARCYAYFYGLQHGLAVVRVRLTYYGLEDGELKCFHRTYGLAELAEFFLTLADRYILWLKRGMDWKEVRNQSIGSLEFPFPQFRRGQRKLAGQTYRSIRDGGRLFAQAPTGIGKTMATLFPAIKAMGEGHTSKLFYLTARTITRTIAEKALDTLRSRGLRLRSISLTAKEKACLCPGTVCDSENCEFARGYFDRVGKAVEDILEQADHFHREQLEEYAKKYRICPFEFALDLSLQCDCIVCDYNYAFDPSVALKRYFMFGGNDYTFLVDEAHNLLERAREIFSAEIDKKSFLELRREGGRKLGDLYKVLGEINSLLVQTRKDIEAQGGEYLAGKEAPDELASRLRLFSAGAEAMLASSEPPACREKLLECYFQVQDFLRSYDYFDERFVSLYRKEGNNVRIRILCLDPSRQLNQAMKKAKAVVLFSATLTPLDYFIQVLGGGEEAVKLRLTSPFPRDNLCLLVHDAISTRFKMRELTYDSVAEAISVLAASKTGNYLVYFPSYKYLEEVCLRFASSNPGIRLIWQRSGMTEWEREEFLQQFSEYGSATLVGFAVMGGMFGEGIDLVGECLSGVAVVGVGLPQVCPERELIRSYYEDDSGMGFAYAYVYPGMNKVMQAVGRVIRTEEDRGAALLIDERFSHSLYQELFPPEWENARKVSSTNAERRLLQHFWTGD